MNSIRELKQQEAIHELKEINKWLKNYDFGDNYYPDLTQLINKLESSDINGNRTIEQIRDNETSLIKELQQRVDKAVEYVNNNSLYEQESDYDNEDNLILGIPSDEKATNDLLNILKGNDN